MNVTHLSMLYRETKSEEIIHYSLLKNFHSCPKNGAILQRCHRRVSDTEKFRICKVKKKCCVLKLIRFLLPKASYSTILSMAILLLVCFNLLKQRQKLDICTACSLLYIKCASIIGWGMFLGYNIELMISLVLLLIQQDKYTMDPG